MIDNRKKELIAHEVIKTLFSRFLSFPEDSSNNRNAPFHEAFLNAFSDKLEDKVSDIPFFISLSSWLHGLNTTLGQSFFENVAHILSDGYKKEFTKKRRTLLKVSKSQKDKIAEIITDLKNGNKEPDLDGENEILFSCTDSIDLDANNFTADVFWETDDEVVAIELKTVKPNAGEMRGEKQKIIEGKSALYNHYTDKQINYFMGFPFDPTSDSTTGYDKSKFLDSIIDGNKYFANEEVKLADELWNYLSNDNSTMQQILDIINSIAKPGFLESYNYILDCHNMDIDFDKYKGILKNWNLFGEINLAINKTRILSTIEGNAKLNKIYNQPLFKEGKYNIPRFMTLKELL